MIELNWLKPETERLFRFIDLNEPKACWILDFEDHVLGKMQAPTEKHLARAMEVFSQSEMTHLKRFIDRCCRWLEQALEFRIKAIVNKLRHNGYDVEISGNKATVINGEFF